jgi:protein TonB
VSSIARGTGGERNEPARWAISFAVVCALHVAAALAILSNRTMFEPAGAPPDAVLIDLAPTPQPVVKAPQPAPPSPPEQRKIEQEEQPPPPNAVTLPKPPPPKPTPPRPEPERVMEAPPQHPAQAATTTKAEPTINPTQHATTAAPNLLPTWEKEILARIDQFKRYPRRAQIRHQEGTAYLRFTVARNGDVIAVALQRSSGIEDLDREALSLLDRAKPLPAAPANIGRDSVELVVPVRFTLR